MSGDLRVVGPNGAEHDRPIPPRRRRPRRRPPPAPPTPPAVPASAATASAAGAGTDSDDAAAASTAAADADEPTNPAADDARLDILRALERGEIDIEEATRRLAAWTEPTDG